MTRRTFDLWLTLLAVFGGGLATVGAVWLGARLALRQDRRVRREERRQEAIEVALASVRNVQQHIDRTISRETRRLRFDSNARTLPLQTRDVDTQRAKAGDDLRIVVQEMDNRLVDAEAWLPSDVATNRVRLADGLRGVAEAVALEIAGDNGWPDMGRVKMRAELLEISLNLTSPVLASAAELLTFAARDIAPPYRLDTGPLDELDAFVAGITSTPT